MYTNAQPIKPGQFQNTFEIMCHGLVMANRIILSQWGMLWERIDRECFYSCFQVEAFPSSGLMELIQHWGLNLSDHINSKNDMKGRKQMQTPTAF